MITGRKKQTVIGTFETELEALNALSLYHLTNKKTLSDREANALDPDLYEQVIQKRNAKIPTFKQIFDILYEEEFSQLSKSSINGYNSWIRHFDIIYNREINTISLQDLQSIFNNENAEQGTKIHMKVICCKIFKYAVIHQFINCGKNEESKKHYASSIDEIKRIRGDNSDVGKIIFLLA